MEREIESDERSASHVALLDEGAVRADARRHALFEIARPERSFGELLDIARLEPVPSGDRGASLIEKLALLE